MGKGNLIGERSSDTTSHLSTFEYFNHWGKKREEMVIPVGSYFLVGVLCASQTKREHIRNTGLFIQGYRVHTSRGDFSTNPRGYGKLVVCEVYPLAPEEVEDDLYFADANLYKAASPDKIELIFSKDEWREREKVEALFAQVCSEKHLTPMSEMGRYAYECPKSSWYYLKGQTYEVWSMLVNAGDPLDGLPNKVLICDLNSGIPGVVDFQKEAFHKL